MKRIILFSVAVFICINLALFAQDKAKRIDELMSKYYDFHAFNGTVLVADNGEVIYKKGFGFANAEWDIPNSPDTKFRLGSITKQFTSMLIMQLVEKGKLKLDDKLSDYLPYYRKDIGEKVTIHQLLTHTSGIPSYTDQPGFFENDSRDPYEPKEFIEKFCSGDLVFEPGSKIAYNNSGYFILGAIIEEVTKMTYEQALIKNIFEPCGMKSTGYDHWKTLLPKRATGYEKEFKEFFNSAYLDMSLPYAAGSLYSTVEDLFLWARALSSHKLLSEKYSKIMFEPYMAAFGAHYAYGWIVGKKYFEGLKDSLYFTQHGGGINGFNTLITRFPETGQLVVLLNNVEGFPAGVITDNIIRILNGLDYDQPKLGIGYKLFELIEDEGIQSAVETYKQIKEHEAESFFFSENELNGLGYYLLKNEKFGEAIEVFELNIEAYPNSGNVYDSMGEAYMKKGDNELAIVNYKKSLELSPGNGNAKKMLAKLGIEIKEETVKVPVEILQQYVGKYQLNPNFILAISIEGEQIFVEATGQPKFEIFPKNETEFYLKVVNAQIKFVKDADEKVEKLILFQNGQEMPAPKIIE
ncbi:MAG: serine hydrolase [bacterium]